MKARRTKLVAFTGIDGAGKSSLCSAVKDELSRYGLRVAILNRWDILDCGSRREYRFLNCTEKELKDCIGEMRGNARTFFMLWLNAASSQILDDTTTHDIVLADGYWYKHAAAELVYGCPEAVIEGCWQIFPIPDLTFYCDISPELAYDRKAGVTNAYECGDVHGSRAAFESHQAKLRNILSNWAEVSSWVHLDASPSIQDATAFAVAYIRAMLAG